MRGGTKRPTGRARPEKSATKLRSTPATRGQVAKTKRTAAAGKKPHFEPSRNAAAPDQTTAPLRAELDEAREQQAATAEILQIINQSSGDPAPVFEAILVRAMRLCDAAFGGLLVSDGEFIKYVAFHNVPERFTDFLTHNLIRPRTLMGPSWETGLVFNISDLSQSEGYRRRIPVAVSAVEDGGARAMLLVPMVKEGAFVGAFTIYRQEVRPFTTRQIALTQSFADQAVIAIENARLLSELRESLERQTAMAEVLGVISSSPGQLQPVFAKMLQLALRLCDAHLGSISRAKDGVFSLVAQIGMPGDGTSADHPMKNYRPPPHSPLGRLLQSKSTIQVADYRETEAYVQRVPSVVHLVDTAGARSTLQVPLLHNKEVIGAFTIFRSDVRPFESKVVTLVESFADQAVIAIENARLLTELQQSLNRQTATADILRAIASTPEDPTRALDTIAETAARMFGGANVGIRRLEGDMLRMVAVAGPANREIREIAPERPLDSDDAFARAVRDNRQFHDPDTLGSLDQWPPSFQETIRRANIRTAAFTPLNRNGKAIGAMVVDRAELQPFLPDELELMKGFADQAVIAIENARLLTELRESLDRQTAMSEVLSVISASPGQVQPVFEKMLECALRLCRAHMGTIQKATDGAFSETARIGAPSEFSFKLDNYRPPPDSPLAQLLTTKSTIRIDDYRATKGYAAGNPAIVALVHQGRGRSAMQVPMVKDSEVVGAMTIYRPEVRPFDDRDATIAEDFAKQAVIAIENARLLTELRESLEQQHAMAELLQSINSSPGDLAPVFDAILEKAHTLCGAERGSLFLIEGETFHAASTRGYAADMAAGLRRSKSLSDAPPFLALRGGVRMMHQPDLRETIRPDDLVGREVVERSGVRTNLLLPLRKEDTLLGVISCNRLEVRPFSDKEIALLESFAAQAVIAMDNARLLNEIRQRQAELRVTFDNMGDAVIMFDEQQHLIAWNRNFLQMLDIPEEWLANPRTYGDFAAYLRERGEFGDTPPPDLTGPDRSGEVRPIRYERVRPNGRVLEVRRNPIPGGAGFVFIYSDITERKLAEQSILAAREAAEHALADLKLAQANLIQSEKMASLGALTAGIAHEIKNPLNFVNNFASLSNELLGELKETAAPAFATLDADRREEVDETMAMLTGNLEKIEEHGRRADGIVKSMLAHSRGGSGDRREADVNALIEESLNLAYHGARAQDQNFNITLERDYDKAMKPIELAPQDVTRVFLNLCGNGFYAANKRCQEGAANFRPVLKVSTRELGDAVEVRIRDNGIGIQPDIKDKLFQPFFTTKPTGEGTGLGLSISYDIVTQQHGGTIAVDSRVGDFTEFTIRLPRKRRTK